MGHHHGNSANDSIKNIRVAFFLNLSFTIIEIIGGFMTNSVAVLSDAIHDLGDSFSLGISWYFQKLSLKESDEDFSYGYKRYSVLGALFTTIILAFGSIFIIWETSIRLLNPEEVNPKGMILLAVIGIIINGLAALKLRHGHSLNEKAVALHLLEDVLGWIAVLVGAIIMLFWDIPIIDPILSLLISGYILYGVYKNFRHVLDVILQKTPKNVNLESIKEYFANKQKITDHFDLHVWSLDGSYHVMTVNIIPDKTMSVVELSQLIEKIKMELRDYNIHHATIEIASQRHIH